jgi:hypothetical protein
MTWLQTIVHLRPRARGFHLVTDELLAVSWIIGKR